MNELTLENKNVFVTGAASGIGYAQAAAFLRSGAHVFGFDVQENGLQKLKEKYEQFSFAIGSVTDKTDVKRAVQHAIEKLQTVDILLNTAGILDNYKPTLETDEWLWDRIFDTNVKGTYFVTNEILPMMLKQKYGVIINMASIAGIVAGGGGAAYTAAKHAIVGYTKQLAYDYSRKGIRVNAIAPGAIRTPMNEADFQGDGSTAKWVADETPAGRWAEATEVAALTKFLASDEASFMHGAVVPFDGGWTIK